MANVTWKAALIGGAVTGVGLGGFVVANGSDRPALRVDDVTLRLASASVTSPTAPVTVLASAVAVAVASGASAASAASVAPSTTARLPDICPGGDFTSSSWDNSCGVPPPAPAIASADSPDSPNRPAPPPRNRGGGSDSGSGSAGT